jgi:hypothetical protein
MQSNTPRKSIPAELLLLLTLPIDPYPSGLTLALCTLPAALFPPLPPAAAGRRVAALRGRTLAFAALAGRRDADADAAADADADADADAAARVGDVDVICGFRERSKDKKPELKVWVFESKISDTQHWTGRGCDV